MQCDSTGKIFLCQFSILQQQKLQILIDFAELFHTDFLHSSLLLPFLQLEAILIFFFCFFLTNCQFSPLLADSVDDGE